MNKYREDALKKAKVMMGEINENWKWVAGKAAWFLIYSSEFNTYTKKIMCCSWWLNDKKEGFKKDEAKEFFYKALFADARVIRKLSSLK